MPPRKWRIRVVLDTNVFVRSLKAAAPDNPNYGVVRLWLCERRLDIAVCREITDEYLRVFSDVLGLGPSVVERWGRRFDDRGRVVSVRLGKRVVASRDPDDNVFLSTALAARARYVVTNDRDLLDLPADALSRFRFMVVTPTQFLRELESPGTTLVQRVP